VTTIGCPHVVTTTTETTIDVAVEMTVTVMTGDMMSSSRRTAAMSASYLLHQR
jgi:hypothetical protein